MGGIVSGFFRRDNWIAEWRVKLLRDIRGHLFWELAGRASITTDLIIKNLSNQPIESLILLLPFYNDRSIKFNKHEKVIQFSSIFDASESLLDISSQKNFFYQIFGSLKFNVDIPNGKLSISELDFKNLDNRILYEGYISQATLLPYYLRSFEEQLVIDSLCIGVFEYHFIKKLQPDNQYWIRFVHQEHSPYSMFVHKYEKYSKFIEKTISFYLRFLWDKNILRYNFLSPNNVYRNIYKNLILCKNLSEKKNLMIACNSINEEILSQPDLPAKVEDVRINIFLQDRCEVSIININGDLMFEHTAFLENNPITKKIKQHVKDFNFIDLYKFRTERVYNTSESSILNFSLFIETLSKAKFPLIFIIFLSIMSIIGSVLTLEIVYERITLLISFIKRIF